MTETTFAWCVKGIARERGVEVEDLELPEASRRALENHMAGENDRSVPEMPRDVADALGIDWNNHEPDSRDLALAYCERLEEGGYDVGEVIGRS